MDENKKKNFSKIDELLESTSEDNRIKFDVPKENITESPLDRFEEAPMVGEEEIPTFQQSDSDAVNDANSVDEPSDEEPQGIRIIDETSSTFVMEESVEAEPVEDDAPAVKPETVAEETAKSKEKIKFKVWQLVLMAVVAVATLWTVVYTVDRTLSAQGYTPIFSFKTEEYADGSVSYVGAGYKTQFMFDDDGNLTQDCVPFWKDGPNDIREQQKMDAMSSLVD